MEGKRIYREESDEKTDWNSEVSGATRQDWLQWSNQLRNVKLPRSIVEDKSKIRGVQLHVFANASNKAVVGHSTGFVKGLLTSTSGISKCNTTIARLELVSGQMAANMVKNLVAALKRWPITSVNMWLDSMEALYYICNPRKAWKAFVSN